jgi:hypothetical protein
MRRGTLVSLRSDAATSSAAAVSSSIRLASSFSFTLANSAVAGVDPTPS